MCEYLVLSFCNMFSFSLTDDAGSHAEILLIAMNNQKMLLLSDEMQNRDIQSPLKFAFSHLKPFHYATPIPASQKYHSFFIFFFLFIYFF